jgi:hypothetical protein
LDKHRWRPDLFRDGRASHVNIGQHHTSALRSEETSLGRSHTSHCTGYDGDFFFEHSHNASQSKVDARSLTTLDSDDLQWVRASLHHERHVDVAAYRVALRADVMGRLQGFHRGVMIEARNGEPKFYGKPVIATLARPDRNTRPYR